MKQAHSSQRQRYKRGVSAIPSVSWGESARIFASTSFPHEGQEHPGQVAQFRHSLDRYSIHPPVPDGGAGHEGEQSDMQQIGAESSSVQREESGGLAESQKGEALQRVAAPSIPAVSSTLNIPPVMQRITYEEAAGQLSQEETEVLMEWLTIVNPGQGLRSGDTFNLATRLILKDIPNIEVLRTMLGKFSHLQQRAASHTKGTEEAFITSLFEYINKSSLMQKLGAKITKEDISSSLHFLDYKSFWQKRRESSALKNPTTDKWSLDIILAKKDLGVEGFENDGMMFLRQGTQNMHFAIHELIHKLSSPNVQRLGSVLAEGLTEELTLLVCKELAISVPSDEPTHYPLERAVFNKLCERYRLQDKFIIASNPEVLANCLKRDMGEDHYEKFTKEKDAFQASVIYKEGCQSESAKRSKMESKDESEPKSCSIM